MKLFSKYLLLASLLFLCACGVTPQAQSPSSSTDAHPWPEREPIIFEEEPPLPSHPASPELKEDDTVVIGMLIPLTGQQAEIGKHLRDAAMLGLFHKRNSLHRRQLTKEVKLIVRDTKGTTDGTIAATRSLLDAEANLIIGPLLADNVKVVRNILRNEKSDTAVIAFSNQEHVAGDNVFVFGFRPVEQVARIANYALDQQIQHFAAIAPQNEYARSVVGDFSDTVKRRGFSLQPVNFFTNDGMPPPPVMERILQSTARWGDKRKGIFLPLKGRYLSDVAASIMTHDDINPAYVKLLGTGLWDDDSLLGIRALQGAWFATTSPDLSRRFNQQFLETYGYKPIRLASLAYDAVALTTTLALTQSTANLDKDSLMLGSGFSGPANGVFRFTPSGLTERGMAVVEITPRGFQVIDPAPTSF